MLGKMNFLDIHAGLFPPLSPHLGASKKSFFISSRPKKIQPSCSPPAPGTYLPFASFLFFSFKIIYFFAALIKYLPNAGSYFSKAVKEEGSFESWLVMKKTGRRTKEEKDEDEGVGRPAQDAAWISMPHLEAVDD